jgi:hypothetical protein
MVTTQTTDQDNHAAPHILRTVLIGVLVGLGCILFAAYTFVRWTERQVLTTDNWVTFVTPLPKQPEVSSALGNYITSQVFANVPVEQKVADALPAKAAFLASPLTDQLHSALNKATVRVVSSDGFQTIWSGAHRAAMNRLLATARGQTPPLQARIKEKFNINLSGAKDQLGSKAGSISNVFPSLKTGNAQPLALSADLQLKRERLHQFVRLVDFLAKILPLLVLTLFLGALALAYRRRITLMIISIAMIALWLLELIGLKIAHTHVLDQVKNKSYEPAISFIYNSLVASLQHIVYTGLVLAFIIIVFCLVAGKASWARSLRGMLHTDKLHETRPLRWWREARYWVRQHEYYIWLVSGLLVLVYLAFNAAVNWQTAINSLLIALSFIALIHIVATPRHSIKQSL